MSTDKTPLPEAVRERVKAAIRAAYPGGCKMLSLGSVCDCLLCDVDRIAEAAAQHERARLEVMRMALQDTLDYWDTTGFSDDCEPGCDCIVDGVRAALSHPPPTPEGGQD